MDQTSNSCHAVLPAEVSKRVDMVVAVCMGKGYVNRKMLAKFYGLTQLQASILLREFLENRPHDVRHDCQNNRYVLVSYPTNCDAYSVVL